MKVTVENYKQLANGTLTTLGNRDLDGAHMALGITTEYNEMWAGVRNSDPVNVVEEIGDTFWYIAGECSIYNLDFQYIINRAASLEREGGACNFQLENIVDLHKREFAYKKQMNITRLTEELILLTTELVDMLEHYNTTIGDCLQKNIEKLNSRYPNKFTTEAALNRNLKKEREILES